MSEELFESIERHDLTQLENRLSDGVDPNRARVQEPRWRPLHAAIEELEHGGPFDALVLLLRFGADVNGWDTNRDATPLLMALFRNQLEAVRLLLAKGADVNVVGSEGDSPLRWCVERDDPETASLILLCGATSTINEAGGFRGMTALGLAASRLNIQLVGLLLRAGADPQAQDADHKTARERLPVKPNDAASNWDEINSLLMQ